MKFVHCADVHLDSALRNLQYYNVASAASVGNPTRKAFENLVSLCIEEGADFLVIAGDLYDGDWRDFNTGLYFVQQIVRLRDAGVQVFVVHGNHDAQSRITKSLPLPENVHVFSARHPETKRLEELGVAIHGQSYSRPDITSNLAADYPDPIAGYFNIGILHTCVGGHPDHEPYAPCSLSELETKGYQYWALGHVHQRVVLSEEPYIVFPGNLQGRHIRELEPKGCSVVTVANEQVVSVEHKPVDVLRWARIDIDASDADSLDEVWETMRSLLAEELDEADGLALAVRMVLEGACLVHDALIRDTEATTQQARAVALDVGSGDIWVERVEVQTTPPRQFDGAIDVGGIGELHTYLEELLRDPEATVGLVSEVLSPLIRRIPTEAQSDGLRDSLLNPESAEQLLRQAGQYLLTRLKAQETD